VDRDDERDRGNAPPGELGSFDVSKRGGTEIAAELAARMARWRSARKRPDVPARGPPARAAAIDQAAAGPPAAPPPNADRPPTGLDAARTARLHRALRTALQARAPQTEDIRTRPLSQARAHGAAFQTVLAGGSNTNATGVGSAVGMNPGRRRAGTQEAGIAAPRPMWVALAARSHEALRRARAFSAAAQTAGVTAWRALSSALAHAIDVVHRRIRAIALAADRTGLAAVRSLRTALRNRLEKAPLDARAFKAAVQRVDITGWRAPRPRIDQALRHARAIGAAAWHAKRDWVAIAGAAAIAVAIAAWFLVPSDRLAPPVAPRQPDVASPRDDAGAPVVHPLEPPQAVAAAPAPAPAPQVLAAASPPPQARPPDTTSARLPARLKPILQAPALAVRLKPPVPETPDADPTDPAPPADQSQETTDAPQERGDPRAVDSMVSDGHGLSRRDDSAASAALLR
jgi:hypothetical protein